MTPRQYQKRLRLLEARRLIEYSRTFGLAPRRDVVSARLTVA